MKQNLIMTPENQQAFERSLEMLDNSIKELRRVANNMMPEALVSGGLDTALAELCKDIQQTGALRVTYESAGMQNVHIDLDTALILYRIVQELIGNIIQHAGAANAVVQLNKAGTQLNITVKDDGKGFDTAILETARGTGWENIVNKINFLNGTISVDSGKGKGTAVSISLTV